ncbi:hypothetical protein [Streptomyces sp. CL7]|uniref:hypothetical protein n=1 Tax=Streptomyces sp. CL7 TaxID=3096006 RepID=UPI0039BDB1DB
MSPREPRVTRSSGCPAAYRAGTDGPWPGEALDCFVDAYTSAYGALDSPRFRRGLARQPAVDPRIDRYWELVAEVVTEPGRRAEPTPGTAHDWLLSALAVETGTPPTTAV